MEKNLVFSSYRNYNGMEICGIFTAQFEEAKIYHFCFKTSEKEVLTLKFKIDENTLNSFSFNINKVKSEDVKITKFYIEGGLNFIQNKFYDNYCFLIDFACEKYGFINNEKSYKNLNCVIYFLFYLYCLNSLEIDCRDFSINPYTKEKNCAFFEEVLKIIWCTKKQKLIFCFLFFQTYFYFKSFDFNFFF